MAKPSRAKPNTCWPDKWGNNEDESQTEDELTSTEIIIEKVLINKKFNRNFI